MPCRYYTDAEEAEIATNQLHKLTRLLCRACTLLESAGRKKQMGRELSAWWNQHQAEDRARKNEQREVRKKNALRKQALKKLTPKERQALRV